MQSNRCNFILNVGKFHISVCAPGGLSVSQLSCSNFFNFSSFPHMYIIQKGENDISRYAYTTLARTGSSFLSCLLTRRTGYFHYDHWSTKFVLLPGKMLGHLCTNGLVDIKILLITKYKDTLFCLLLNKVMQTKINICRFLDISILSHTFISVFTCQINMFTCHLYIY